MTTIINEGIELPQFTFLENELIGLTILDASEEAYHDLFNAIEGIRQYFREELDSKSFRPLPRLLMSIDFVEEKELENDTCI